MGGYLALLVTLGCGYPATRSADTYVCMSCRDASFILFYFTLFIFLFCEVVTA